MGKDTGKGNGAEDENSLKDRLCLIAFDPLPYISGQQDVPRGENGPGSKPFCALAVSPTFPPHTGRGSCRLKLRWASIFNPLARTDNDFVSLSGHILVFSFQYPPYFWDTPQRFFYYDSYGRNRLHHPFFCMLPYRNLQPMKGSCSI